jgi:DNA-directed RNA polymerase omega subunit
MRDQTEEAVERGGSRFGTINAIAKRAIHLTNGCQPLVGNVNVEKPAMTALREIAAGKVAVGRG